MRTKFNINSLIRRHLIDLKPYSSSKDEFGGDAKVWIDANENPFQTEFNRYPDTKQWALKSKIAEIRNTRKENIVLGNGSDELIDLLLKAFCEPSQDEIMICPPTYGMYSVSANILNIPVKVVPLRDDFSLDCEKILDVVSPKTKIIFICNPNNPTGNSFDKNDIIKIIENFEGLVVIDEAYIDFSEDLSFIQSLNTYPNLFVMQTLSKAWGLAGLRIGMGFASREIISIVEKIKPPFNINIMSQEKSLVSLQAEDRFHQNLSTILEQRAFLIDRLRELKTILGIFPTQTNFILARIQQADQMYEYLLSKGIVVRNRSKDEKCENCLRITVGTQEENLFLLENMRSFENGRT